MCPAHPGVPLVQGLDVDEGHFSAGPGHDPVVLTAHDQVDVLPQLPPTVPTGHRRIFSLSSQNTPPLHGPKTHPFCMVPTHTLCMVPTHTPSAWPQNTPPLPRPKTHSLCTAPKHNPSKGPQNTTPRHGPKTHPTVIRPKEIPATAHKANALVLKLMQL